MSAHKPNDESRYCLAIAGEFCFFCGRPVYMPHVEWHGLGSAKEGRLLVLHPVCAANLSLHLGSDAIKAGVGISSCLC